MTAAAEILNGAADLLSKRGAWIGGPYAETEPPYARDALGNEVSAKSPRARCWCLYGAIEAAAGGAETLTAIDVMWNLVGPLANWNHGRGRTKKQVIAKLREAAALSKVRAGEGE